MARSVAGRHLSLAVQKKISEAMNMQNTQAMELLLAEPRGFCAGVARAIEIVERALAKFGAPIYVRHEIVHNTYVVNDLKRKGAIFIENLDDVPPGATLIFSAHGVPRAIKEEAARRGFRIFDATCPLVSKVHVEVAKLAREGYEFIMIGHKGHPEVEGTMGQLPAGAMQLVENVEGVAQLAPRQQEKIALVTQTTLSVDDAAAITAAIRARFPNVRQPKKQDICYATQNRQDAVKLISSAVDIVIVVGSPTSSNSRRLAEVAQRQGVESYLVDSASDIRPEWLHGKSRVGLSAGASAPDVLVQHVIARLRNLGATSVRRMEGIEEKMHFPQPKGLRLNDESEQRLRQKYGGVSHGSLQDKPATSIEESGYKDALQAAGANINAVGESGNTALMEAVLWGREEQARALIAAGADIHVVNKAGETALEIAASQGLTDIVRLLLEVDGNIAAVGGDALLAAAYSGRTETVRFLLDAGADKNAASEWGWTALTHAVSMGAHDTVKLLLEAGFDVNVRHSYGNTTPLIIAAMENRPKTARVLLDAGADMNATAADGSTALIFAAELQEPDVTDILLQYGADTDIANESGWTALLAAADNGYADTVRLLLRAAADIDMPNQDGKTALMLAEEKGHEEVARLLREAMKYATLQD